ncbi:unnamed protein product [Moneuplotes crassus]|uniref:Replication protein A subunit n=2 Tax=Euplotes crassus TaxID=5936 RepID=A0AAD1X2P7_EUPCR|nr:unnamed protein product [Moneuplotes crassus]
MSTDANRPKYLTKNAVKTILDAPDYKEIQDLKPVFQILSVKDISHKKSIRDRIQLSDGVHKILSIVKLKINSAPEQAYKANDIVRINGFDLKTISNKQILLPSNNFDIIATDIDTQIGKPKEYVEGEDEDMDFEAEIPYKNNPEERKEESDVEMKSPNKPTPCKNSASKEEIKLQVTEAEMEDTKEEPSPQKSYEVDDAYTPIKTVSPLNSDWIIKARVSKKNKVKEWSNSRGSGKLLNIELIDRHGTQIQATFFNKAVDKFEPMIQEDKVYIFCKGTVKVANQKFTSIKNDYCLTFSHLSEITQTEDDTNISKNVFHFTKLSEVSNIGAGKIIDLIGVVTSVGDVNSISLKDGRQKDKIDYEIADNSIDGGMRVTVSIWGTKATSKKFSVGQIIAIKDLKISTFKGVSLNGGDNSFLCDATQLKLKESSELQSWYRTAKDHVNDINSLTEGNQASGTPSLRNVRLIKEIEENSNDDLATDPTVRYYINARVELVRNDSKMVYMACPSCKKKMTEEDTSASTYRCEKCGMSTSNPVPTYIITVKFTDGTGSIWTRIYGDNALPIMGNTKPEEVHKMFANDSEESNVEIRNFLNSLNFKEFSVMVKPSINSYNGQESLNYHGSNVKTYKPEKSNHFLLQRLSLFEAPKA